jgi:hypothetical protein
MSHDSCLPDALGSGATADDPRILPEAGPPLVHTTSYFQILCEGPVGCKLR